MGNYKSFCAALLLIILIFATGCKRKPLGPLKRYELQGTIVGVDRARGEATISHSAVPGYMDAMTMTFTLKDTTLIDTMAPGDQISSELVVAEKSSWLENPIVSRSEKADPSSVARTVRFEPSAGDAVPEFELTNQDGKTIKLSKYRGKSLAITFIYTRCPLPDYCILMNDNFSQIENDLKIDKTLYGASHLLTISFDPEHDTPSVLRKFGLTLLDSKAPGPFIHWEFATGDSTQLKMLADYFGLTYINEPNQIVHSLRTAIITPDGKLFRLYDGNQWKPAQVLTDLRSALSATQH